MRYEDLVDEPAARIRDIFEFLAVRQPDQKPETPRAEVMVDNRDPDAWRGVLSKLRVIESRLAGEMDSFGYEPAPPLTITERARSGLRTAARPFNRAYRTIRRTVGVTVRSRSDRM